MKRLMRILSVAAVLALVGIDSAYGSTCCDNEQHYYDGTRTWTLERESGWFSGEEVLLFTVTDVNPKPEDKLEIPHHLGDYTVVGIACDAFAGAEKLTEVTVGDGIRKIEYGAFEGCVKLEDITLPSGMEYVDGHAFDGTKAEEKAEGKAFVIGEYLLKYTGDREKFTVPDEVKVICSGAFSYPALTEGGESLLREVVIPEGVEVICDYAFRPGSADSALEKIELPDSVTEVGYGAFAQCWALKTLTLGAGITELQGINSWFGYDGNCVETLKLGEGVKVIPAYCFGENGWWDCLNTVVFGSALEEIGDSAFYGLSTLVSVDFSAATALKKIGYSAFAGTGVAKINLSTCTDLTKLPDAAFCGCGELEKVTFPDGLKTIGRETFGDCDKLAGVTFNEGLETIGAGAFYSCDALEKLEFPSTLRTIGGDFVSEGAFAFCENLAKVTFNEGLETIGDNAFEGCALLEKLEFPASLKTIGDNAFESCEAVSKIRFAEDSELELLGYCAFAYLPKLEKVEIPASVTVIWGYLFDGCELLEKIDGGEGVEVCESNSMFGNCPYARFGLNDPETGEPYAKFQIVTFGKVVIGMRGECRKSIEAEDFGEDVVQICAGVFSLEANETVLNLTSVTLPDTLTRIDDDAFAGAENLKDFVFAEDSSELTIGRRAFSGTGIKELEGTFRSIGDEAFAGCSDLKDVKVEVKAKFIMDEDGWLSCEGGDLGAYAFGDCPQLVSADITATGDTYTYEDGERMSSGGVILACLGNCPKLETVRLAADAYVEGGMFGGAEALDELEFDAPVVPSELAAYLPKLSKVTLGEKVEVIGWYAFAGCEKLDRITIPDSVTCICEGAFMDCIALDKVEGCGGLKRIDGAAFENTDFIKNAKSGALQVAHVLFRWTDAEEGDTAEIDGSVSVIAAGAFTESKVAKVIVPASVEKVRDGTFVDCPGLETVVFESASVKLGTGAASGYEPTWIASKGGFLFLGFGGEEIEEENYIPDASRGYYDEMEPFCHYLAQFEKVRFHNDPDADSRFTPGSTYVGWLMRGDVVVGSITVKTGKTDGNMQSKVTASVQLAGSKKSYTTQFKVGEDGKARSAEGYYSDLFGMVLGGSWMSGSINLSGAQYTVRGGSDVSNTAVFDAYAGHVWTAALASRGDAEDAYEGDTYCALCSGYTSLVFTPGNKGKLKVTGMMADGTKVSSTAQMVAGDNGTVAAPVTLQLYSGKKGGLSFLLHFYKDNGKPCMYFEGQCSDGASAYDSEEYSDGRIGTWRYQLPEHWKPFAEVGVRVEKIGEVNVNSSGFKTSKAWMSVGYYDFECEDDCDDGMICFPVDSLAYSALRRSCKGFGPSLSSAEVSVDVAKGKWTTAGAAKWSLLTKPEQYAAFLAANPLGGIAPDGKEIDAYAFDDDVQIEVAEPGWGTYVTSKPTHWQVIDTGAKSDKEKGKNTNYNAWKLSYNKKSGQFNGSVNYYWIDMSNAQKHAMKTGKMTVGGVMIDGEVYGTAVVKGVCSLPVSGGDGDAW